MNAKSKYPPELWAALEADIANGMTFVAAAEKHGIPSGTVSSHIFNKKVKQGLVPESPSRQRKTSRGLIRKCPCCGTFVDNPKARFCWKCGGDVRSEELQLIEGVEKLTELLATFPSSYAAEGIQVAKRLKAYLQRRG